MIAVDTNVLINAHRSMSEWHEAARARLTDLAEGSVPWALPVTVSWGFVRIVTQSVFYPQTSMARALDFVAQLHASPSARVLNPGPRHWELLAETLRESRARGKAVSDAVIVTLCREHGVDTVLSADRDLLRYPWIKLDPLDA